MTDGNSEYIVQLNNHGIAFDDDVERVARLREHYQRRDWIRLPGLISEALLERVMRGIAGAQFQDFTHPDIKSNKELQLGDCAALKLLELVMNNAQLFQFLNRITDCGHIGSFVGRIYRFDSQNGHHDAWHDDSGSHRRLALSLNLSSDLYEGGALVLRSKSQKGRVSTVRNTVLGDAIVFRIADSLEHRVSNVTGAHPKTAFAGWFRSAPEFGEHILNKTQTLA